MTTRTFLAGATLALCLPLFTSAATLAELQAQLAQLMAQLSALQQGSAQTQTTTSQSTQATTQTSASAQCPNLSRNLSRGMQGSDVTSLQTFLIVQGHLAAGNNTGFYGALTEAAVKQFQCKHLQICSGTAASNGYGAVGPKTRSTIAGMCSSVTQQGTGTQAVTSGTNSSGANSSVTTYSQASYVTTSSAAAGAGTASSNPQPKSDPKFTVPPPTYSQASYVTTTYSQASYVASTAGCTVGSTQLAHGATQTFYSSQTVASGSTCASVAQSRTCTNGVVSGSSSYTHAQCSVLPAPVESDTSLYDFGGMYGNASGATYPNPATNAMSCPSGYTAWPILGSPGFDFDAYFCYRPNVAGSTSALDFGGTYGLAPGDITYKNPATNAGSCPPGFTGTPFRGSPGLDYPGYHCYRYHTANSAHFFDFGGMYGFYSGGEYVNPATGATSCPSGYTAAPIVGASGVDFNAYSCYKPKTTSSGGASCTFGSATVYHGGSIPAYKSATVSSGATCEQEIRTCNNGVLSGSYPAASCTISGSGGTTGSGTGGTTGTGGGTTASGASCTAGGVTVASGASRKFYLTSSVPTGTSCEESGMSQVRTCSAGVLSGSAAFDNASCAVSASAAQNRTALKNFTPYVWSTTWYPYFNNTVGVDPARSLALLGAEIDKIKAQGFNTLWLGGIAIWAQLQPTPGVWDEARFNNLVAHLELLKSKNMRVIYQLNYVGEGFSPAGIDGCYWFDNAAQVQKFADFSKEFAGRLEEYNSMIYYMVYTEQTKSCLLKRQHPYYYPSYKMITTSYSETVPMTEPYLSYQRSDAQAVNAYLKNSIGALPHKLPKAIRNQIFIGIHDVSVSQGIISGDTPVQSPNDFDYFSFAYYPEELDIKNNSTYGFALGELNAGLSRVKAHFPSTPIMLGEFGWPVWDGSNFVAIQHSEARNNVYTAMLDWSIVNKIGFNAWAWLPRFIDNPAQETSPYEESLQLTLRNGALTSTLGVIRQKLLGY